MVPKTLAYSATGSYGEVQLDMTGIEKKFNGLNLSTTQGSINLTSVTTLDKGLNLRSDSGTMGLENYTALCSLGVAHTERLIDINSPKGIIDIQNSRITHCKAHISASVSSIGLKNTEAYYLHLENEKGHVLLNDVTASSYMVTTYKGSVKGNNIHATSTMRISTRAGQVLLTNVSSDGIIQIETGSSEISVGLSRDRFKGVFTITTSGRVTVVEDDDLVLETDAEDDDAVRGRVNCSPTRCAYYGEIILMSGNGNVKLYMTD